MKYIVSFVQFNVNSLADLQVASKTISPVKIAPGGNLNIGCVLTNSGETSTNKSFIVQYFLSLDTVFSAEDKIIDDSILVPSLGGLLNYTINNIQYFNLNI